jgi:hypothetical protein
MTIDKFHMSQALPSSFIIHYQVCNYSSTTGPTSEEGTSYPFGETEGTAGMLLHINEKFTMGKLQSSHFS